MRALISLQATKHMNKRRAFALQYSGVNTERQADVGPEGLQGLPEGTNNINDECRMSPTLEPRKGEAESRHCKGRESGVQRISGDTLGTHTRVTRKTD